ncbi:hypothetical protein ABH892_001403 [Paenibacillus sp. RC254]
MTQYAEMTITASGWILEKRSVRLCRGTLTLNSNPKESPDNSDRKNYPLAEWSSSASPKQTIFTYTYYLHSKIKIIISQRLHIHCTHVAVSFFRKEIMLLGVGADAVEHNRIDFFFLK